MEEQIIGFFERAYGREPGSLSLETNIKQELGVKSMPLLAVIANIENEFDVEYPLMQASRAETIGALVEGVRERL